MSITETPTGRANCGRRGAHGVSLHRPAERTRTGLPGSTETFNHTSNISYSATANVRCQKSGESACRALTASAVCPLSLSTSVGFPVVPVSRFPRFWLWTNTSELPTVPSPPRHILIEPNTWESRARGAFHYTSSFETVGDGREGGRGEMGEKL